MMPCLTSVNVHRPTWLRREDFESFPPLSGTGLFHPFPGAIAYRRGLSVLDRHLADDAPALVPHFNEFVISVFLQPKTPPVEGSQYRFLARRRVVFQPDTCRVLRCL